LQFTVSEKEAVMSDLFLLSERQMARISPFFPLSHGVPRVDDRQVVSGIIYVIRNGLQWKDAPAGYGPHKTLYNRFISWSLMGVFDCCRFMFETGTHALSVFNGLCGIEV